MQYTDMFYQKGFIQEARDVITMTHYLYLEIRTTVDMWNYLRIENSKHLIYELNTYYQEIILNRTRLVDALVQYDTDQDEAVVKSIQFYTNELRALIVITNETLEMYYA